jgi:hypothetical protein
LPASDRIETPIKETCLRVKSILVRGGKAKVACPVAT